MDEQPNQPEEHRAMTESPLTPPAVAGLLMTKFSLLRAEILSQQGHYRDHVRNFQVMSGGLLAGTAYVLAHPELLPSTRLWWAWWLVTSMVPVVANYLIFDVLESQYAMILLAERIATIEEELNAIAGRRLFIWESAISPRFWQGFRPMPGVINPDWFMNIFLGIIITFTNVLLPLSLYAILWRSTHVSMGKAVALGCGVLFTIAAIGVSLFSFFNVLLNMRGKPRILINTLLAEGQAQD
jgi:hypothetical protein